MKVQVFYTALGCKFSDVPSLWCTLPLIPFPSATLYFLRLTYNSILALLSQEHCHTHCRCCLILQFHPHAIALVVLSLVNDNYWIMKSLKASTAYGLLQ